jgi:hypothetical protein
MSRKGQQKDDASRERLAHLGLAANRAGPPESCPDDDRFAEMLESEAGSAAHRSFFEHLSRCESCFQKWLAVSEALDNHLGKSADAVSWFKRRPVLAGVGSACGLVLVMMLYLALDYRPVLYDRVESQPDDQASIAEPDERVRAEADSEQRAASQPGAPTADSGLVLETETSQEQNEKPKINEPPPDASAPAPRARMKKEATGTAVDSLEHKKAMSYSYSADKGVSGSAATSRKLTMELNQRSPVAGQGAAVMSSEYSDFIDAAADLCRSGNGVFTVADTGQVLEQARMLLKSEALADGESRMFIEYVVNLLEKEQAIDDKERGEFCEKARTAVRQKERSADKP